MTEVGSSVVNVDDERLTAGALDPLPDPSATTASHLGLRAYLESSPATMVAIASTIVAVFVPTFVVPYAFSDDYTLLWMAVSGEATAQFGESIINVTALGGRPLMGLLDQLFFATAGNIENLRFIRLTAVIGIVALALMLHWTLIRARIASLPAALIAVLMCLVPALQIYGAWATLFSQPFAALSAGGGSLAAVAALDGPRSRRRGRLAGAIALLLAALFIYQPAAMFFWVFLAIGVLGARAEPGRAIGLVRTHLGVAAAAFAAEYVFTKLVVHVVDNGSSAGERSTLTHDISGKARWFVEEPLYRALNLFDVTPSRTQAIVVALVSAGGMLLWLGRHSARPFLYGGIGVVLIPLTYLPNLVVTDMWPPFRTQIAISSLMTLYVCLGAIALWTVSSDALRSRKARQYRDEAQIAALTLAVAFVGVAAFVAAKNVSSLIVEPQMTELRLLRRQVNEVPANTPRVAFVLTDWYGGMTERVLYDEFGLASSVRPWVPEPAVSLILRETGRPSALGLRPAIDVYSAATTTFPKGQPVLNLHELRNLRGR